MRSDDVTSQHGTTYNIKDYYRHIRKWDKNKN